MFWIWKKFKKFKKCDGGALILFSIFFQIQNFSCSNEFKNQLKSKGIDWNQSRMGFGEKKLLAGGFCLYHFQRVANFGPLPHTKKHLVKHTHSEINWKFNENLFKLLKTQWKFKEEDKHEFRQKTPQKNKKFHRIHPFNKTSEKWLKNRWKVSKL